MSLLSLILNSLLFDDISTDNADMHILGYYEDRIGAYPNINSRDGPSGQGTR